MTAIWDRTQAVGARRLGALATIALAVVWLPGLIQLATRLTLIGPGPTVATGATAASAALVALLGIATSLVALAGTLALVALGVDPSLPVAAALRIGVRRLLPMLGLVVIAGMVLMVATLPILAVAPGLATMQTGAAPALTPTASLFVRWYSVLLLVALLWVEARVLLLLPPVVVEERRGLGAVGRTLRMTRGLTWRLIGAILLFALVAGVAVLAARSVAGVAAWLLIDGVVHPRVVQFVASAAASLVAAGFAALAAVFAAQLYLVLARDVGDERGSSVRPAEPAGAPVASAPAKAGPWG